MGKTINFSFAINGLLDPSFNHMTSGAKQQLGILKQQAQEANRAMKGLRNGYKQGTINQNTYDTGKDYYSSQLKQIREERGRINAEVQQKMNAMLNLSDSAKSLVGFGLSVKMAAAPFVGLVNTAANFEAAMSKVGAITNASADDMKKLTMTARELGEKTQFTATQSADAMSYLGMAGWNAEQIMQGMPGLLNLAAAGGTDLARTADIVSDDLTAFGLSAEQASHMADVYAVTITKTNTNVEMLGDTMKYAAPVAHAFGVSMEETAALAGLMANSGIKASQAGTALRAGFLRLAGPPKMAADALNQLGLSAQDLTAEQKEATMALESLGIEAGNVEGPQKMAHILTELREKMKGLSGDEQLATAKAIFGQEAASGWLAVLNSAPGTFEELVKSIQNSDGAAEKMAKTMQNNAKGAMTRLSSAAESMAISIGGVLLPTLADAGDAAAGFVGNLSSLASEYPGAIQGAIGLTAGIVGFIGIVKVARVLVDGYRVTMIAIHGIMGALTAAHAAYTGTLATSTGVIRVVRSAMIGLNAAMAANPVGAVVVAITAAIAAGYLLYKNWDTVKGALVSGWNTLSDAASNIWEGITNTISNAWNTVASAVSSGWNTVKETVSGAINTAGEVITHLPYYAGYAVGATVHWFSELPNRIEEFTTEAGDFVENSAVQMAENVGNGVTVMVDWFAQLPGRVVDAISELPGDVMNVIVECESAGSAFISEASSWGSQAVDGIIQWFSDLPGRLTAYVSSAWESAKAAVGNFKIGFQAGSNGEEPDAHNAYGGIYPRGEFITTFAEKSPEAAIPLDGSHRSISLWEKTGSMIGAFDSKNRLRVPANARKETHISVDFKPNITIQGNADETVIQNTMQLTMNQLKRMLQEIKRDERRVVYE